MFKYNCKCGYVLSYTPKNGDLIIKVCDKCGKIYVFNAYKEEDGFEVIIRDTCVIGTEFVEQ